MNKKIVMMMGIAVLSGGAFSLSAADTTSWVTKITGSEDYSVLGSQGHGQRQSMPGQDGGGVQKVLGKDGHGISNIQPPSRSNMTIKERTAELKKQHPDAPKGWAKTRAKAEMKYGEIAQP